MYTLVWLSKGKVKNNECYAMAVECVRYAYKNHLENNTYYTYTST